MNKLTTYLTEVRARLERATPGPWRNEPHDGPQQRILHSDSFAFVALTSQSNDKANAELIAHAPTDIAALLRALECAIRQRNTYTPSGITDGILDDELIRALKGEGGSGE